MTCTSPLGTVKFLKFRLTNHTLIVLSPTINIRGRASFGMMNEGLFIHRSSDKTSRRARHILSKREFCASSN